MYEEFKEEYCKIWFQYILDHPDKPWEYDMLSQNPNITWEIVKNNPYKPWDYNWLSLNPNIQWEIRDNPYKK